MRQDMTKEAAEEILELPPQYTKEDVRRAYTKLARRYHPDAAARHHMDHATAQARMVEANKANETLRALFEERPNRRVSRGFGDAGGRTNFYEAYANENIWETSEGWSSEPATQKPKLGVRSVLLGPVVLRVLLTACFAVVWWFTFPLLAHNRDVYFPQGSWTLLDIARLVAAIVYPTYLLLYEAFSGLISGFVREVLNGAVSWITGRYIDLRPHSASYGCALYKLLREQVYALVLAPIALFFAGMCVGTDMLPLKIVYGVLALLLGLDTLFSFVHGGLINVWTSALAERVEARYLLIRRRILARCGIDSR